MNYRRIHDEIINSARARGWTKKESDGVYVETHHIIPKSSGGTNDIDNLIVLSAREHYLIHWLLYKINPIQPNAFAWHSMQMKGPGREARYTSHSFKYAREAKSRSMVGVKRDPSIGAKVGAAQRGKVISDEQRLNHSVLMTGRKLSKEHRDNIGKGLLGGVRTDEQKARMSAAAPKTPVVRIDSNGVKVHYNSVREAAELNSMSRPGISKCITGSRKSYKGFTWMYLTGE